MATIIESNQCTITIADVDYTCQITDAAINTSDSGSSGFATLCGEFGTTSGTSYELALSFAYDSGEDDSLFDSLWDNDGTTATFVLAAAATKPGSTFTGTVTLVATGMQISAGQVVTCDVVLPCQAKPARVSLARTVQASKTDK